ncbi:MAG: peptidoglycan-binding protein [Candidatus Omnitrophota bacterium]
MKKIFVFAALVAVFTALSGCSKKQEVEELEPITLESLSATTADDSYQAVPQESAAQAVSQPAGSAKDLVPLPPQGPYKPTNTEIQTALKNAGYYSASIDGKIGPKSKKAIEDFQSANGLKVDGKVGSKTWEALGRYLNISSSSDKR